MCNRGELERLIVFGLQEIRSLERLLTRKWAGLATRPQQSRASFLRNLANDAPGEARRRARRTRASGRTPRSITERNSDASNCPLNSFGNSSPWRSPDLAVQRRMGILPQWWSRSALAGRVSTGFVQAARALNAAGLRRGHMAKRDLPNFSIFGRVVFHQTS